MFMKKMLIGASLIATSAFSQEVPVAEETVEEKAPAEKENYKKFQIGIVAGFSHSNQWSVEALPGINTGETTAKYDAVPSVALEVRAMAPDSFGFQAGINYDFESTSKSDTALSGTNFYFPQKIQTTTLYVNLNYQWTNFYLPFGINYSRLEFKHAPGRSNTETDNGYGIQLGAGWAFNRNLSAELMTRSLPGKLTAIGTNGSRISANGSISSIHWALKYYF